MLLDTRALEVFVALVPTFIASLPHAPTRTNVETVSRSVLRTHNAITTLRFEVSQLLKSIPKDHTAYELSTADHEEATSALEDIFYLFLGCLDDPNDSVDLHEMTSTLETFKNALGLQSVPALAYTPASSDRIHWYRLRTNNSEASEYWEHTKVVKRFNEIMTRVYARAQPAKSHSFGGNIPDRHATVFGERERQLDMIADMSASTKAIADVILMRHDDCAGHPTYVRVSANNDKHGERIIETLTKDCGNNSSKEWYAIQWIQRHAGGSVQIQYTKFSHRICGRLKKTYRRKMIRIEIERDDIRHKSVDKTLARRAQQPSLRLSELLRVVQGSTANSVLTDRLRKGKSIRISLGSRIAETMLYLVGSALIQSHWKADDLLIPHNMDIIDDSASNLQIYGYDVSKLDTNPARMTKHFVLEFGALLWELFFLQEVEVLEEDKEYDEDDELNEEISLYNALVRTYEDGTALLLQTICLEIVSNCLEIYEELEEGVTEGDIRARIYDKIVKPLQDFASTYSETSPPRPVVAQKTQKTWEDKEPISNIQMAPIINVDPALQEESYYSSEGVICPTLDEVELFRLDLASTPDGNKSKETADWKKRLRKQNLMYGIRRDPSPKIRIAILDTGIDKSHPQVLREWYQEASNHEGRIRDFKDFVHGDTPKDVSGHGTHIAGIILDLSSNTHVYIGRVVESQKHLKRGDNTFRHRLVQALQHARDKWNVDIISLSFGFSKTNMKDDIRKEIEACQSIGIAVFASASNDGGHQPRTYPGAYPRVLCIHSSTAMGAASEFNPTPAHGENNFMCVGEYVQSWWPKSILTEGSEINNGMKLMSGTSFATPVAIVIAVFMIGYIRKNMPNYQWDVEPLSIEGVRIIFRTLSFENARDGYDFLSTEYLFAKYNDERQVQSLLIHKLHGHEC